MSFESSDFKQFDLPFDLDYLNSVDIVDSSVDAKKDDIVFISTNNEEQCRRFVEESIEKKAGFIFTSLNLSFDNSNVLNSEEFDNLLSNYVVFFNLFLCCWLLNNKDTERQYRVTKVKLIF